MQHAGTMMDHFLAHAMLGTLEMVKVVKVFKQIQHIQYVQ